jgi:hypothetical protein
MVVVPLVDPTVVVDETDIVLRAQRDRREFATLYRRYLLASRLLALPRHWQRGTLEEMAPPECAVSRV